MEVTVCVPTYNQDKYVGAAIKSALSQSLRPVEIVVSDDASTDGTFAIVSQLAASEASIRCLRHSQNLGIAENNARLMQQVATDFVVRLDSDDELLPDYIYRLLAALKANPEAGYAHCAIQRIDGNGRELNKIFLKRAGGFVTAETALKSAVTGYRVAANIVMYRTAAIRQVNFFHGRPQYVEDFDMSVRLAAAGWGNVYVQDVLARYRVWSDAGGHRVKRKALELAGYKRVFDEVFTPAFKERAWDEALLTAQRRHLALVHAPNCFLPHFSAEERQRLIELLRALGPSKTLEFKMALLSYGFASMFERCYIARQRARATVKRLLRTLRA